MWSGRRFRGPLRGTSPVHPGRRSGDAEGAEDVAGIGQYRRADRPHPEYAFLIVERVSGIVDLFEHRLEFFPVGDCVRRPGGEFPLEDPVSLGLVAEREVRLADRRRVQLHGHPDV